MLGLPNTADLRKQRDGRTRANKRREHFMERLRAATDHKQRLAVAFDYLRAALAAAPDASAHRAVDEAVDGLVRAADQIGAVK